MFFLFFFNDTATTEIYTLSLHDALPISGERHHSYCRPGVAYIHDGVLTSGVACAQAHGCSRDRKSTCLNSSHLGISYAVFCLKKKKKEKNKIQFNYKCIHTNNN